jgi:hypothetical protein
MVGDEINHNSTVKYATIMKAACNVKFVGFNAKHISNIRENGGLKLNEENQFDLFFRYFHQIIHKKKPAGLNLLY